jgi:hypothetical protein
VKKRDVVPVMPGAMKPAAKKTAKKTIKRKKRNGG